MRTGNVIRPPGDNDLWIVTDVDDRCVSAVSFDHPNCSAIQRLEDHTRDMSCCEGDSDCACGGTGSQRMNVIGWKDSTVVASYVREFILQGFKKTMGLSR